MSSFHCGTCGTAILDSPDGYITGCEHFPLPKNRAKKAITRKASSIKTPGDPSMETAVILDANETENQEKYRLISQLTTLNAIANAGVSGFEALGGNCPLELLKLKAMIIVWKNKQKKLEGTFVGNKPVAIRRAPAAKGI